MAQFNPKYASNASKHMNSVNSGSSKFTLLSLGAAVTRSVVLETTLPGFLARAPAARGKGETWQGGKLGAKRKG